MRRIFYALLAIVVLSTAGFAQYAFTKIDYPGAALTRIYSLNNRGQWVGQYRIAPAAPHAMMVDHGVFVPLDPTGILGTHQGSALCINDRGDIVGTFVDSSGRHGYLLREGVVQVIDYPGAAGYTQVTGINEAGTMIGVYADTAGIYHGFTLAEGTFAVLDVPGALDTLPLSINAQGEIVGEWDNNPAEIGHGFLYTKDGQFVTIDHPEAPANSTLAISINALGEILGFYQDSSGVIQGFLIEGESFVAIDVPDSILAEVQTINNAGQVVGWTNDATGRHGFIANPIPKQKP